MMAFRWGFLVTCWWCLVHVQGQSNCALQDGKCVYQVRLATSGSCNTDSSTNYNQPQNDYDQRVNDIEKSLVDVRAAHSRRIEDLENKIRSMLGSNLNDEGENGINTIPPTVPHRLRHGGGKFALDPGDPGTSQEEEDTLLVELHERFAALRHDLGVCRRRRRDCDTHLREVRKKLNTTESALLQTTSKLVRAEQDLDTVRGENADLVRNVEQKGNELNETKVALDDTTKRLRSKQLELWDLEFDNERFKKELADLRAQLARTRKHLAEALRKYHELNVAHEETVQTLKNTTESLVTCFSGKTSQFCGFEDPEICGFEADNSTSGLNWLWHNGETPSAYTGPSIDHTCNNRAGHYLYVEASNRGVDQNAVLVSPRYAGLTQQCVEFYYHMYGRHIGTLNVYTRISEEDFIRAWRAFGNQGDTWINARLPIPEEVANKGYQVTFEGILEKGFEGDIAIDDFRVFDGPCYDVVTTEVTPLSTEGSSLPPPGGF